MPSATILPLLYYTKYVTVSGLLHLWIKTAITFKNIQKRQKTINHQSVIKKTYKNSYWYLRFCYKIRWWCERCFRALVIIVPLSLNTWTLWKGHHKGATEPEQWLFVLSHVFCVFPYSLFKMTSQESKGCHLWNCRIGPLNSSLAILMIRMTNRIYLCCR